MTELAGIEIPAGSRFSIHENPNVAPGVCVVCKHPGGDGRLFVDFGFQLDWYGAIYFCDSCVRELCEAIGFVPKLALQIVQEHRDSLIKRQGALMGEFDDFRRSSFVLLRNCTCSNSGSGDCSTSSSAQSAGEDDGIDGNDIEASRASSKTSGK